jgi:SSS family solute:Na+ symporter/sodium/proline symporter
LADRFYLLGEEVGVIYVWAIGIYLLFLIFVSVSRGRKVKTQDDFMVAGRGVTATMLVATLVCTWIGSGSLFAGAGRAFRHGFSALWMSAGAWLGLAIVYYLAPRVRRIAQYTVPDILEIRYNAASRLLGTVAIIIAYLTIASYQFIGGGRLLEILTGLDPVYGQAIVCGLVVLYTIMAGMSSIVALDIFNGILITAGVIVAAPLALKGAGGWSGLTTTLPETHFTVFGSLGVIPAIGLFLPTFLLLLGESSIYQKFMSAKDALTARRAVIGMIIGVVIVETVLDATAIFGAGQFWTDSAYRTAAGALDRASTETVLLDLAANRLPVVAGILLLIGAAAIIFSTANTFLMIPSTNLTRDVYQRFINPNASQKNIIFFQRSMIVLLALVAFLVTSRFENILDMALYAYTMVGAAVTPALLAAFLWKRVTPMGGMVSIASGIVATMVFAGLAQAGVGSLNLGLFELPLEYDYIIYPAGFASFLSLIVVSLLTPPSAEEKWRPFFGSEEKTSE